MINKNTPYVKQFDENGHLLNPIQGSYVSPFPNRQRRKAALRPERFMNFSKKGGTNLVVKGRMKFKKFVQEIKCIDPKTSKPATKRIYQTQHVPSRY